MSTNGIVAPGVNGESKMTIQKVESRLKKNKNSYISKLSPDGTVYHITKENMEFWHTDFKNHVISLQESKGVTQ